MQIQPIGVHIIASAKPSAPKTPADIVGADMSGESRVKAPAIPADAAISFLRWSVR